MSGIGSLGSPGSSGFDSSFPDISSMSPEEMEAAIKASEKQEHDGLYTAAIEDHTAATEDHTATAKDQASSTKFQSAKSEDQSAKSEDHVAKAETHFESLRTRHVSSVGVDATTAVVSGVHTGSPRFIPMEYAAGSDASSNPLLKPLAPGTNPKGRTQAVYDRERDELLPVDGSDFHKRREAGDILATRIKLPGMEEKEVKIGRTISPAEAMSLSASYINIIAQRRLEEMRRDEDQRAKRSSKDQDAGHVAFHTRAQCLLRKGERRREQVDELGRAIIRRVEDQRSKAQTVFEHHDKAALDRGMHERTGDQLRRNDLQETSQAVQEYCSANTLADFQQETVKLHSVAIIDKKNGTIRHVVRATVSEGRLSDPQNRKIRSNNPTMENLRNGNRVSVLGRRET